MMPQANYNNNTFDQKFEGECNENNNYWEYSHPSTEVRIEKAQYSTIHLKRLVEDRKELILAPYFQRHDVWTKQQSSELVESILMGIPIPTIYLFEMKSGKKQVVDGRQRITSIIDFLNDKLCLRGLKILHNYNGRRFSEMDPMIQGIFEDYQLSFYVIQPPTPERVKYEIFDRVNRGGTRINNQEMRNALYNGRSTDLLNDLSGMQCFIDATNKSVSPKRMKDKYIILRAIAFYLLYTKEKEIVKYNGVPIEYKSDIDDFLAKTMIFINERAPESLIENCKNAFITSMNNCHDIMGKDAFRFESKTGKKRPISMPLFEIMMFIFADNNLKNDINRTRAEIDVFKHEFDKKLMFSSNTDSSLNVLARYTYAKELIRKIKDDK